MNVYKFKCVISFFSQKSLEWFIRFFGLTMGFFGPVVAFITGLDWLAVGFPLGFILGLYADKIVEPFVDDTTKPLFTPRPMPTKPILATKPTKPSKPPKVKKPKTPRQALTPKGKILVSVLSASVAFVAVVSLGLVASHYAPTQAAVPSNVGPTHTLPPDPSTTVTQYATTTTPVPTEVPSATSTPVPRATPTVTPTYRHPTATSPTTTKKAHSSPATTTRHHDTTSDSGDDDDAGGGPQQYEEPQDEDDTPKAGATIKNHYSEN